MTGRHTTATTAGVVPVGTCPCKRSSESHR